MKSASRGFGFGRQYRNTADNQTNLLREYRFFPFLLEEIRLAWLLPNSL
jgi:hypothetical protein